jgi:hypothetical protein
MPRFILRFNGPAAPPDNVTQIKKTCKVVDESPRMLLVECAEGEANRIAEDFPGWKASPEVQYKHPDPPVRVLKGVDR